ncbi:MAG: dienelactone hydrolase family protein [Acidimicrobiia bacterium]
MSVLKGEGRVPILFGSLALAVPPHRSAYIARPDVEGEHPTTVIAHDAAGITPASKAVARHLARHGYAVLVPDLMRGSAAGPDGFEWDVSDLVDAVDSARIPGTEWASGRRIALLGLGAGGVAASVVAAEAAVAGLVLVGSSPDPDILSAYSGALLVLHGAADEVVPADEVRAAQQAVGRGEWVLYGGVGAGFFDDGSEDHDPQAAADGLGRIVGFLDHLLRPVAAA